MSRKLSLRWLIPLVMVGSVVPMILALTYWHHQLEYKELIERYRLQGEIAMRGFQSLIEAGLVHGERKTLKQAVLSVSQFPCFSRALGVDSSGRVFLSSQQAQGRALASLDAQLAARWPRTAEPLIRLESEGQRMAVYRPLNAPELKRVDSPLAGGWLFLELDLSHELAKHWRALVTQSLMATGVVVVFSLLLWFWLSRNLTQPLRRMTQAVGRMGEDAGGVVLQEECCYELSELAKGFSRMGRELERRYASLRRQRVLYQALSQTNQTILHSSDEERLLVNVCEAAVEAGLKLVWIGYVDKRSGKLSIMHTAGEESGWLETIRRHVGIDNDPLVQMVKRGEEGVIAIDDEAAGKVPWYTEARLNGFASGACFSIRRGDAIVGGLVVMSDDAALLDEDGRLLLREMADDIGFALSNLDREILRRRMEQNLAHERGLLRALVDTIPDIIFYKDHAQTYMGCNQAFEELVSLDEGKLVGGTDRDIFPSALSDVLHAQDKRILDTTISERMEVWLDKPDGRRILVDLLKAPFRDAEGAVIGLVGVGRDVTSEYQAQQDLQQALTILQRAERISNIGTWSFDPQTRVMHWSETVFQILGYDPETTVPDFERLFEHCHGDDREKVQTAVEGLRQGEVDEFTQAYRIELPEGGTRYLVGRGSICTLGDRQSRVIGTVQDVTQQHLDEETRRATLDSVRLQQKQALIGELTSGVVHELNEVLTPILGFAQLANESESASCEQLRGYLQRIGEAAERGKQLLLRLTAISQSRQHEPNQAIDLVPLTREVVNLLTAALPATVRIDASFADDLPNVLIDADDYKQIVLTLALQVRDSIDKQGELRLSLCSTVSTRKAAVRTAGEVPGNFVEIIIEGLGEAVSGYEDEPRQDAWQVEGGGLSSRIVDLLLRLYEGELEIDSLSGELLRYRLLFPVRGQMTGRPLTPFEGKAPGKGYRVLLVDDEESVTGYLQEFLQVQGFAVEVFTESQPALEAFLHDPQRFDLLITDQVMPGMDGLQLIAALHELRRDLPVILCSGYSAQVSQANADDFGVDLFLQKPVSLQELMQAIRQCLWSSGGDPEVS